MNERAAPAGTDDAGGDRGADDEATGAGPTRPGAWGGERPADAGPTGAGPTDTGPTDAGQTDAGPTDAGPNGGSPTDAGGNRERPTGGAAAEPTSASGGSGRGGRRLDRAPGERYVGRGMPAGVSGPEPTVPVTGSAARAAAFAAPAAVVALMVYVGFAGPLAFSAGLVIIGIFAGRVIGLSAKVGAARSIPSDQVVVVALLVTLVWFVVAQVGTWLFARNEGGVLPILDYLLQTFGPVVPLVAIASILAAWWSAR